MTAALHAAFFFQSEFYHPFHLFSRVQNYIGPVIMGAGAAVTGIVLVCALVFMKRDATSQLGWFTLALGTPFLFIAFGEFAGDGYSFDHWEGGNYLVPVAATTILFGLRLLDIDRKEVAGPAVSA